MGEWTSTLGAGCACPLALIGVAVFGIVCVWTAHDCTRRALIHTSGRDLVPCEVCWLLIYAARSSATCRGGGLEGRVR
ncbi:hypothetical protein BC628DRAFT_1376617 [Trametes gibbosa]|nr:hypothetical protein BC628DRAFT_1376617 [Trametes gibbosa]